MSEPLISFQKIQQLADEVTGPGVHGRNADRAAVTMLLSVFAVGYDLECLAKFTGYSTTATGKNSLPFLFRRMVETGLVRLEDGKPRWLCPNGWDDPESGSLGLLLDAMTLTGLLIRYGDTPETYSYDVAAKVQDPSYSMMSGGCSGDGVTSSPNQAAGSGGSEILAGVASVSKTA